MRADETGQCLAFDVLHYDKTVSVTLFESINRADVRVVQLSHGLGFLHQLSFRQIITTNQLTREKFKSHFAHEASIVRKVNFTHASSSEGVENLVGTD